MKLRRDGRLAPSSGRWRRALLRVVLPVAVAAPAAAILLRADGAAVEQRRRGRTLPAPSRPAVAQRRTPPPVPSPPPPPFETPQPRSAAPSAPRDEAGAVLRAAVLERWGPDATVTPHNSSRGGRCFSLSPSHSEPVYGRYGADVVAAYTRRTNLSVPLGDWLQDVAVSAASADALPAAAPDQALTPDGDVLADPDDWWPTVRRFRPARKPLGVGCVRWVGSSCAGGGGDAALPCDAAVGAGQRGRCECAGGHVVKECGWGPVRCADVCEDASAVPRDLWAAPKHPRRRVRVSAAVVTLTQDRRLGVLVRTLHGFVRHVHRPHGPMEHVLLSDQPFSAAFRGAVTGVLCTPQPPRFATIPAGHWAVPPWVDSAQLSARLSEYRRNRSLRTIPHIGSLSYRKMCRWYAGYFARHPALRHYDYFWRLDDDVTYFCDLPVNPISVVSSRNLVYGFATAVTELMATVPSLMRAVLSHADVRGSTGWLSPAFLSADNGTYTGCHFWNNFAVGDLRFFRSPDYLRYFESLDRAGGFFFERWGDAPVQTLGVALLAPVGRVAYLEHVGYGHDQFYHVPADPSLCRGPEVPNRAGQRSLEGGCLHWSCVDSVVAALRAR